MGFWGEPRQRGRAAGAQAFGAGGAGWGGVGWGGWGEGGGGGGDGGGGGGGGGGGPYHRSEPGEVVSMEASWGGELEAQMRVSSSGYGCRLVKTRIPPPPDTHTHTHIKSQGDTISQRNSGLVRVTTFYKVSLH